MQMWQWQGLLRTSNEVHYVPVMFCDPALANERHRGHQWKEQHPTQTRRLSHISEILRLTGYTVKMLHLALSLCSALTDSSCLSRSRISQTGCFNCSAGGPGICC